jgi:hypothetical protein
VGISSATDQGESNNHAQSNPSTPIHSTKAYRNCLGHVTLKSNCAGTLKFTAELYDGIG